MVERRSLFTGSCEGTLAVVERFALASLSDLVGYRGLFVFRELGRACYGPLRDALRAVGLGDVLLVAIPEGVVDYSWADETLGRLQSELRNGEFGDRYLIVEVSDDNQYDNVNASYAMRKALGLVLGPGDKLRIAGHPPGRKLRAELVDTLLQLNRARTITSGMLAQARSLQPSTAAMRLQRLWEAGLARRQVKAEDPRQNVYVSLLE